MASTLRIFGLVVLVLAPGGLLFLMAFLATRSAVRAWQGEHSSVGAQRLVRALASVRLHTLWVEARGALRARAASL